MVNRVINELCGVDILKIDYRLKDEALRNHIRDIIHARAYVKCWDEGMKRYFKKMIPEYARILYEEAPERREALEITLESFVQDIIA